MQVELRKQLGVQKSSVVWWYDIQLAQDGQQAVVQLDKELQFFDVVVWGKESVSLCMPLEDAIFHFLENL